MTNLEAIEFLSQYLNKEVYTDKCYDAHKMAIDALKRVKWEDTLWHDAKTDPPNMNGLYYGKKDDTNSMYSVNYNDGMWALAAYPDHKIEILQWAQYASFYSDYDD